MPAGLSSLDSSDKGSGRIPLTDVTLAARWFCIVFGALALLAVLATLFGWVEFRVVEGDSGSFNRNDHGRAATPWDAWVPGVFFLVSVVGTSFNHRRFVDLNEWAVIYEKWWGWNLRIAYQRKSSALGTVKGMIIRPPRDKNSNRWIVFVDTDQRFVQLGRFRDQSSAEAVANQAARALGVDQGQIQIQGRGR